jgi:magnesium chelatase family protein
MFSKIKSLGLFGLNAFPVDVEIETSRGTPAFECRTCRTVVKETVKNKKCFTAHGALIPLVSNSKSATADTKKSEACTTCNDLVCFV